MIKLLLTLCLLSTQNCYDARVVHVVDGDTIDVDIELGFGVSKRERIRLVGVDAWELTGDEKAKGVEAKAFVQSWTFGRPVSLETDQKRGKYGRLIADLIADGKRLSEALIREGHAERVDY
jgi:micrococcal nuclease